MSSIVHCSNKLSFQEPARNIACADTGLPKTTEVPVATRARRHSYDKSAANTGVLAAVDPGVQQPSGPLFLRIAVAAAEPPLLGAVGGGAHHVRTWRLTPLPRHCTCAQYRAVTQRS